MHHKYGKQSQKSYRPKRNRSKGTAKKSDWEGVGPIVQWMKEVQRCKEQLKEI